MKIKQNLWIAFVLFVISIIVSQSRINSRASRSTSNQPVFNISNIERLSEELCVDLGLYVSQTVLSMAKAQNINGHQFLHDMLLLLTKIFRWHNIRLNVRLLHIFTTDPFPSTNQHDQDLFQLTDYIKTNGNQQDVNMYLKNIVNSTNNKRGGYAYLSVACKENAVGVLNMNNDDNQYDVMMIASLLAHEIGHQLGFAHADRKSNDCQCGFGHYYCIGNHFQYNVESDIPKSFENCLIKKLQSSLPLFTCMNSCSTNSFISFCGDGVVNKNEKCDCAFPELCKHLGQDTCCDQQTCRYKESHFQCATGECCENCQYTSNKVCQVDPKGNGKNTVCTGLSSTCQEEIHQTEQSETYCSNEALPETINNERNRICRYYFNQDNFFSQRCYTNIDKFLKHHCGNNATADYFYESSCQNGSTICDYLVCEGNEMPNTYIMNTVNYGTYYCNYYNPREKVSSDIGGHNGIKCSDQNYVCFEGKCEKCQSVSVTTSSSKYLSQIVVPVRIEGYAKHN